IPAARCRTTVLDAPRGGEDRCAADLVLTFLDRLLEKGHSATRALQQAQRMVRSLSLDEVLHQQEELERATPGNSTEHALLLARKARLCGRFGRDREARHFAQAAVPALRAAGLGDQGDRLSEEMRDMQVRPRQRKPVQAGDDPLLWG